MSGNVRPQSNSRALLFQKLEDCKFHDRLKLLLERLVNDNNLASRIHTLNGLTVFD